MDAGSVVLMTDKDARFRSALGAKPKASITEVQCVQPGNYRLTQDGQMKALSQNLAVLMGTPKLSDSLGWNLLADKPAWRKKPPFLTEFRAEIHDQDAAEFAFWASDNLGADFKTNQAMEAIEVHAKRHPFHPVQEYLQSLRWDGISRIDHWLSDAFGVPETDYHAGVARSFLISAVARAMNPGCQVDTMLVLMGDQGLGKTSAARALVPDFSMYAETTESPAHKDFYQALRGKWIVEIGELHSFKNADWTKIKQMLSAKVDTYRPSYGHFTKDFPRQCIFIGTTNDEQWNRDTTGARRFWPVICIEVNKDYILAQRVQLWAEAYARFQRGESWWDVADQDYATDAIAEGDPWDEPVSSFISAQPKGTYVTGYQALMAMGGEDIKITKRDEMRVGDIFKRIKLKHKRVTLEGKQKWVWIT